MSGAPDFNSELLRQLMIDYCGLDLGALQPELRLVDVGLSAIYRLRIVAVIEDLYDIEFPADLLSSIETVDDLVYFTRVKVSQRAEEVRKD